MYIYVYVYTNVYRYIYMPIYMNVCVYRSYDTGDHSHLLDPPR